MEKERVSEQTDKLTLQFQQLSATTFTLSVRVFQAKNQHRVPLANIDSIYFTSLLTTFTSSSLSLSLQVLPSTDSEQ